LRIVDCGLWIVDCPPEALRRDLAEALAKAGGFRIIAAPR
jgi:hypothetical protein